MVKNMPGLAQILDYAGKRLSLIEFNKLRVHNCNIHNKIIRRKFEKVNKPNYHLCASLLQCSGETLQLSSQCSGP